MDDGRYGEEVATRFLRRRGWLPIARNWPVPQGGELDIVALRDGILAIVEVKTRRSWSASRSGVAGQRARTPRGYRSSIGTRSSPVCASDST